MDSFLAQHFEIKIVGQAKLLGTCIPSVTLRRGRRRWENTTYFTHIAPPMSSILWWADKIPGFDSNSHKIHHPVHFLHSEGSSSMSSIYSFSVKPLCSTCALGLWGTSSPSIWTWAPPSSKPALFAQPWAGWSLCHHGGCDDRRAHKCWWLDEAWSGLHHPQRGGRLAPPFLYCP